MTEREITHAWLHGRAQGVLGLAMVHAGRSPGAVPGLDPQVAQIQALRHLQSAHRMEPHDLHITYNLALLLVSSDTAAWVLPLFCMKSHKFHITGNLALLLVSSGSAG